MLRLLALALALIATPASAWTVTHEKDRMTDKTLTWASVESGDATLLVGCLNGQVQPRLTFPRRAGWGSGIGVSWRYDDGPVQAHAGALFSQDGLALYPWVSTYNDALAALRRAHRLRIGIGREVFDFDLAKGGQAMPTFGKC
jgi:hypothetical protein